DGVPELVENRHILRNAPHQRPDDRPCQRVRLQRLFAEELAVQHRIFQHADSRMSANVCNRMSSSAGGTFTSKRLRASSSRVRNRTISFSVFLLVTMGICTKLKRRLRAVERSLTPRSRLLAVAMMLKPGLAKTTPS